MHRSQRPACRRLERVIGREYVGRGRSGREAARAALSGRACGAARTRDGNVEAIRTLVVAKRSARSTKIKTLNQIRHLSYTAPEQLRLRPKEVSRQQLAARAAALRQGSAKAW